MLSRRLIRKYLLILLPSVALLWIALSLIRQDSNPEGWRPKVKAKKVAEKDPGVLQVRRTDNNNSRGEFELEVLYGTALIDSQNPDKDTAPSEDPETDFFNVTVGPVLKELLQEEQRLWKEHTFGSEFLRIQSALEPQDSAHSANRSSLPYCPDTPPALVGRLKQGILVIPGLKSSHVQHYVHDISPGGTWAPEDCRAQSRLAIIVPFRDREAHLNKLLAFLIPVLQRQQREFMFIVTEQYGNGMFNKGRIMNAAFTVARGLGADCVVFHDVDMYPQDDRLIYNCSDNPQHLGAYVNTLGYQLWYDYIAGGVLAITTEQYMAVNGYSNLFWAWGGEDDDMGKRILALNYTLWRPDNLTGRFSMLKHTKRRRTAPKIIHELLAASTTLMRVDGLARPMWRIVKVIRKPLYYHLYVDVGDPPHQWTPA